MRRPEHEHLLTEEVKHMIDYEKKKIQLKEKINAITADIIVLRAKLNYWERQKRLAIQKKTGVDFK